MVRRDIVEYAVLFDQRLKNLIHENDLLAARDVPTPPLLAWQVASPSVGTAVRSATRVPKEIDEKHELSRPCRDFGAPNAGSALTILELSIVTDTTYCYVSNQ